MEFPLLYGKHNVSLNIHNIAHLGRSVRLHGPLWTSTCFHYESFNHILLKSIVGTYRVERGMGSCIDKLQWVIRKVRQCTDQRMVSCLRKMGCRFLNGDKGVSVGRNVYAYSIVSPKNCGESGISQYKRLSVNGVWMH